MPPPLRTSDLDESSEESESEDVRVVAGKNAKVGLGRVRGVAAENGGPNRHENQDATDLDALSEDTEIEAVMI